MKSEAENKDLSERRIVPSPLSSLKHIRRAVIQSVLATIAVFNGNRCGQSADCDARCKSDICLIVLLHTVDLSNNKYSLATNSTIVLKFFIYPFQRSYGYR